MQMREISIGRHSAALFTLATALLFASCSSDIHHWGSDTVKENIIFIPSTRDSTIRFETTIFTPINTAADTAPIAIINHGTSPGGHQPRDREIWPTQFFTHLGYTVVLPMRQGYANSTGERSRIHGCDLTQYGLDNAADIEDVVTWLRSQELYKSRKIIMIGQSTGGLATMAYSSLTAQRVDAIINFHGGVRPASPADCKWQARIDAFRSFAKTSSPPSLWIYTANDHSSNPAYISKLYAAFKEAGGTATLVQLPAFKSDGHYLFGDRDGGPIWQPIILDYLRKQHLYP